MGGDEFKQQLRDHVWSKLGWWGRIPPFGGQEEAAGQLDGLDAYAMARSVFATPDQALYHARLKVMQEGKRLVMATPRIREGFYELGQNLEREVWPRAVRTRGAERYGRKLETSNKCLGRVDLMLTGAVAVSEENGVRIGKGTGYGDLEYGILFEIGSIDEGTPIVTLVHDCQVFAEAFPREQKDVPTDWIITPTRSIEVRNRGPKPTGLDWSYIQMHMDMFMEMRPIRELYNLRLLSVGRRRS